MKSGIQSKIRLSIGVLGVVIGCSSTAFSQTTCSTVTIAQGTNISAPGRTVEVVDVTDTGDLIVKICRGTANPSPPARPTSTPACPKQPAEPTVTEAEAPWQRRLKEEEARRQRQEEADERRRNRPGGLGKIDQ